MIKLKVKYYITISLLCIIILISITFLLRIQEKRYDSTKKRNLGKTYSIEYELNGGTLCEGAPSSYVTGKTVKLPTYIVKDGYGFTGWYDNPKLTGDRIYSIPSSMVGNVTLFAGFEDVIGVKCEIYDYYSDSQYNPDGATPKAICENLAIESCLFQRFNTRLCVTNNYDRTWRSVQYPLYMGGWGGYEVRGEGIGALKRIIFSNGYKNDLHPDIDQTFRVSSAFGNCISPNFAVAYQGLVDNVLTNGKITQSRKGGSQRVPVPLFNASYLNNTKHMKTTYMESPMSIGKGYTNLLFPLRKSSREGYYEFNSLQDTIRYNDSTGKLDYLGQYNAQVKDTTGRYGVYPFNDPLTDSELSNITHSKMNHGYGIRVDIPFYVPYNMKINGEDVIFEFTGDDDVWVFIDGYLALDLGGQHGRIGGTINLTQEYSVVDKAVNPELLDIVGPYFFEQDISIDQNTLNKYQLNNVVGPIQSTYTNYRTNFPQALKNALQDRTKEHTISIFYMERAKGTSNFMASFNMPVEAKNEPEITNGYKFRNTTKRFFYTYDRETLPLNTPDVVRFKINTNDTSDEVDLIVSKNKNLSKKSEYLDTKYFSIYDKNWNEIYPNNKKKFKLKGNTQYIFFLYNDYLKTNLTTGAFNFYLHSDLYGNTNVVNGEFVRRKSFDCW